MISETYKFLKLGNNSIKQTTINGILLISIFEAYIPCFIFYEEYKAKKVDRNSKVAFSKPFKDLKTGKEVKINYYIWGNLSEDIY